MAPTAYMVASEMGHEEPISRTYQYRKVMKPMLERKRRARINRCLDELKELMVAALQSEGENVSKLEKADILELTVRHLHGLKQQHQLVATPEHTYADRFRAGFTHCAQEVSQFLSTPTDIVDPVAGAKLLQHLGSCIRQLDCAAQKAQYQQQQQQQHHHQLQQHQQHNLHHQQAYTPPASPATMVVREPPQMWRPW